MSLRKKKIHGMKISFPISEAKRTLSYELLTRQGKGSKGWGWMQWALQETWGQVTSTEFTKTLRQERKSYCVEIYIAIVQFIFVVEMALGHGWSISSLRSITRWSQYSTGNPMFLCLFRCQGSLGSAQSCGMFRVYCQHSIVKLTNFLCSLVSF